MAAAALASYVIDKLSGEESLISPKMSSASKPKLTTVWANKYSSLDDPAPRHKSDGTLLRRLARSMSSLVDEGGQTVPLLTPIPHQAHHGRHNTSPAAHISSRNINPRLGRQGSTTSLSSTSSSPPPTPTTHHAPHRKLSRSTSDGYLLVRQRHRTNTFTDVLPSTLPSVRALRSVFDVKPDENPNIKAKTPEQSNRPKMIRQVSVHAEVTQDKKEVVIQKITQPKAPANLHHNVTKDMTKPVAMPLVANTKETLQKTTEPIKEPKLERRVSSSKLLDMTDSNASVRNLLRQFEKMSQSENIKVKVVLQKNKIADNCLNKPGEGQKIQSKPLPEVQKEAAKERPVSELQSMNQGLSESLTDKQEVVKSSTKMYDVRKSPVSVRRLMKQFENNDNRPHYASPIFPPKEKEPIKLNELVRQTSNESNDKVFQPNYKQSSSSSSSDSSDDEQVLKPSVKNLKLQFESPSTQSLHKTAEKSELTRKLPDLTATSLLEYPGGIKKEKEHSTCSQEITSNESYDYLIKENNNDTKISTSDNNSESREDEAISMPSVKNLKQQFEIPPLNKSSEKKEYVKPQSTALKSSFIETPQNQETTEIEKIKPSALSKEVKPTISVKNLMSQFEKDTRADNLEQEVATMFAFKKPKDTNSVAVSYKVPKIEYKPAPTNKSHTPIGDTKLQESSSSSVSSSDDESNPKQDNHPKILKYVTTHPMKDTKYKENNNESSSLDQISNVVDDKQYEEQGIKVLPQLEVVHIKDEDNKNQNIKNYTVKVLPELQEVHANVDFDNEITSDSDSSEISVGEEEKTIDNKHVANDISSDDKVEVETKSTENSLVTDMDPSLSGDRNNNCSNANKEQHRADVGSLISKFAKISNPHSSASSSSQSDIEESEKEKTKELVNEGQKGSDVGVGSLIDKFAKINNPLVQESSASEDDSQPKNSLDVPTVSPKKIPGKTRTLNSDELRFFGIGGAPTEPFVRSQSLRMRKTEPQPFYPRGGSLRLNKTEAAAAVTTKKLPRNCRQLKPDELRFFDMGNNNNIYQERLSRSSSRASSCAASDGEERHIEDKKEGQFFR